MILSHKVKHLNEAAFTHLDHIVRPPPIDVVFTPYTGISVMRLKSGLRRNNLPLHGIALGGGQRSPRQDIFGQLVLGPARGMMAALESWSRTGLAMAPMMGNAATALSRTRKFIVSVVGMVNLPGMGGECRFVLVGADEGVGEAMSVLLMHSTSRCAEANGNRVLTG